MAKSTAVAKQEADSPARGLERLVAQGDLGKLTPEERVQYYAVVCESLGLNPLTRPFDYLTLQGKTILYARKDCTDQLRSLRKVSVTITSRERIDDVYAVTARATMPDQRTDESVGAVSVGGLKGDALANALMKAETKAKRRVTLSICGLGILDETEIETTGAHHPSPAPQQRAEPAAQAIAEDVARQTNGRVLDQATPRPMGVSPTAKVSKAQVQLIEGLLKKTGVDPVRFCQAHKVMTIIDLTQEEYALALVNLEGRQRRMAEEEAARQAEEDPDGLAEREAIEQEPRRARA